MIEEFYTQGGFEIGATVARHASDDEFDIDAMAQVGLNDSHHDNGHGHTQHVGLPSVLEELGLRGLGDGISL